MPISEHPMQALAGFLPPGSFDHVVGYLHRYHVHLTVTQKRKSVLGDYRHAHMGANHRITVNGDLNPYEFLITLLHELAHLLTFEQFGRRVEPHGIEWKRTYATLLQDFIAKQFFPEDVTKALRKSVMNPAATANGEMDLLKVLRRYNPVQHQRGVTVEELPDGALFETEKGKQFRKLHKRRTRIECVELKTGLHYSFSPITEVKPIQQQ